MPHEGPKSFVRFARRERQLFVDVGTMKVNRCQSAIIKINYLINNELSINQNSINTAVFVVDVAVHSDLEFKDTRV